MAAVNKIWIVFLMLMLSTLSSIAHTVYAPNDISLLDNRFRIDPNTEQVTIILNHVKTPQKIVIVQPDGSKLYQQRHPKQTVGWSSNSDQDIITINNPMPGPWQAIATLHGDNRIQLLNPITLRVEKLPLKVYRNEYLTTHVSLLQDKLVMSNKDFLKNAKLKVSINNERNKLVSLYKDDGQHYDSLPFDGKLSTHIFMDLTPGRYLLNIKTKNNIFVRSHNKDLVVFPIPLTYNVQQLINNTARTEFTFKVDDAEIDPNSITIDGLITSYNGTYSEQSILHFTEKNLIDNTLTIEIPLAYELYTYSAKVFATTKSGREISFQLPERTFELIAPPVIDVEEINAELTIASQTITTDPETMNNEEAEEQSNQYIWIILAILAVLIIIGASVIILIMKSKQKKLTVDNGLSLDELTLDEMQPTEIDINDVKN